MKVVLCTPTLTRPYDAYLEAVEKSVPVLDEAGIEHQMVFEVDSPYISWARANLAKKALDAGADVVVFIDHDLSWEPEDLLKLIQTEGDCIAGTYRFKRDEETYMGTLREDKPVVREDGCVLAEWVPAGFLKLTREGIEKFRKAYPHLIYGKGEYVDLFNHGAHNGLWYGEDYAFSRNWNDMGEQLWIVPDLNLTHHRKDDEGHEIPFKGNWHEYLLKYEESDASVNENG